MKRRPPETRILFWGLMLAVMMMGSACQRVARQNTVLTARGEAPIATVMVAQSEQRRAVPWSDRVLRQSVSFQFDENDAPLTPGTRLAKRRLEARESARSQLLRELAGLPAGEAPPGEQGRLTMAGFSRKSTVITDQISSLIESNLEESFSVSQTGGVLQLELNLEPIAKFILLEGGGFLPNDPMLEEQGPERRARDEALVEARRELFLQLAQIEIENDFRFADWLQQNPNRLGFLQEELLTARIDPSRSGRRDWIDGPVFQVVIEFDYSDLRDRIRVAIRQARE